MILTQSFGNVAFLRDFALKIFMQPDLSLWGIYTMPIGLAICFGPVLIAWAIDVAKTRDEDKKNDKR